MSDQAFPPHGALMRRFALDWLGRVDAAVPAQIMASDYTVSIGGHTLAGLDGYVRATVGQYERYLGLLLTVHQAIAAQGRTALRFTLHGAEPAKSPVAWTGIALFAHDGKLLHSSWVEEDYLARRRQQASGRCDPIEAPMPAPWAVPQLPGDPGAEAVVRDWLKVGDLARGAQVVLDDAAALGEPGPPLLLGSCEATEIFSAGDTVAFQAVQTGTYCGGLPDVDDAFGRDATISLVGLVRITPDGPSGHVVRDRLGLRRRLQKAVQTGMEGA